MPGSQFVRDYADLVESEPKRQYIVVAFWGVETSREFFTSRSKALARANLHAGQGADVHVAKVIGERVLGEDDARAASKAGAL